MKAVWEQTGCNLWSFVAKWRKIAPTRPLKLSMNSRNAMAGYFPSLCLLILALSRFRDTIDYGQAYKHEYKNKNESAEELGHSDGGL